MDVNRFKEINTQLKTTLIDIFSKLSIFDFHIVEPSEACEGQYWIISTYYFNQHESSTDVNLLYLKRNDINSFEAGDINFFFRQDEIFLDEVFNMNDKGYLDSLIHILKDANKEFLSDDLGEQTIGISISSKYFSEDPFKRGLLEEFICSIVLNGNNIFTDNGMSVRKSILVPSGEGNINYYIPYDKIEMFPRAFQTPKYENPNSGYSYIFVIMSFQSDPILIDAYNAMVRVVKKLDKKITIERVDLIEDDFKITEKIIECINKADLIISDLTGERPNVYYELGYAIAKGKKVIRTAKYGTNLHFDVKDLNTIFWRNTTELENSLLKRLKMITKK